MSKKESFRPLVDFEKQIDEAFIRYSSRLKKRKKSIRTVEQVIRSISLKDTAKLSNKHFSRI